MESRLRISSNEHYQRVLQAYAGTGEIEVLGQKYKITGVHWGPVSGGYYTIMPLIPVFEQQDSHYSNITFDELQRKMRAWLGR